MKRVGIEELIDLALAHGPTAAATARQLHDAGVRILADDRLEEFAEKLLRWGIDDSNCETSRRDAAAVRHPRRLRINVGGLCLRTRDCLFKVRFYAGRRSLCELLTAIRLTRITELVAWQ
jgi:hypothetical protein